ncbi:hypothetical protein C8A05DRAFT_45610 [Staphylotrichum tortipilum]|uniref:Uncharacterized protein n=1 Tax=Staphylotrichum tortipilum TaxID=2831512 RepID=A0AAN6MGS1_9PEZI|nr:hypothetical protein C8A05DRAFT_45610 [Staphylotrichum longicolle]
MADSPFSTPKRKRSEMTGDDLPRLDTTAQFTFDPNPALDDGNASPRTRVAHRFRGLVLGSGGGASDPPAGTGTIIDDDGEDVIMRKRIRLPDVEMRDAETPPPPAVPLLDPVMITTALPRPPHFKKEDSPGGRQSSPKSVRISFVEDPVLIPTTTTSEEGHDTPTPSLTPPTSPPSTTITLPLRRPRPFKRSGTPPFPPSSNPRSTTGTRSCSASPDPTTDPTTATTTTPSSLTWHDSEITIYDPDDSGDDGTGINGIGFKPTPAIAYARAVRRRQQLAEYKKREEREARAKRSLRRRGGSPAPGLLEMAGGKKGGKRRVRFLEREGTPGELIGV